MKGKHSIFLLSEKPAFGFLFLNNEDYSPPKKKRTLKSQGVDTQASWHVCMSRSLGRSCAFLPDYTNCNNTEGGDDVIAALKEENVSFSFPVVNPGGM